MPYHFVTTKKHVDSHPLSSYYDDRLTQMNKHLQLKRFYSLAILPTEIQASQNKKRTTSKGKVPSTNMHGHQKQNVVQQHKPKSLKSKGSPKLKTTKEN